MQNEFDVIFFLIKLILLFNKLIEKIQKLKDEYREVE